MNVLEEAAGLINGQRSKDYGHPRDNFKNTADLWTAYLGWEIKPLDVGLMMVLLKVARLENGVYHRDSVIDIAGYAGTLERIFEEPDDWEKYLLGVARAWDSLDDVPKTVKVLSAGKALWFWHAKEDYDYVYGDGEWLWTSDGSPGYDPEQVANGPFTEVLETDA